MADNVNDELKRSGRCIVVVSEGFDVGSLGERKDSFGHTMFGASEITVAQAVVNYLNTVGSAAPARRAATCPAPTSAKYDLRLHGGHRGSLQGRSEGRAVAAQDGSAGWRQSCASRARPTTCATTRCRSRRWRTRARLPKEWLAPNRCDVTDDFVRYARPLIGDDWPSIPLVNGRQRFARLQPIFTAQVLPVYVPQALR